MNTVARSGKDVGATWGRSVGAIWSRNEGARWGNVEAGESKVKEDYEWKVWKE